ncbi:MAG: alanine/glycine:cation symporter family protein [Planctomycetota bacterium]|jgi:AGCS family alanine or glycine:cation symporter|nr:alanine/glycine:cation symporter family protein [Planctomycetota bacterium]MDP6763349.1 alanine/glycine:cation symporter family protein [Planctomycetota bacterium]MDP6988778.1 alanine/glycine:cation symporter family protein [Planctomycetota bacterium]
MRIHTRALCALFVLALAFVTGPTALASDLPLLQDGGGAAVEEAETDEAGGFDVDAMFGKVNATMVRVIFFDISFGTLQEAKMEDGVAVLDAAGAPVMEGPTLPIAVVILVLGAIFFTIRMGLPQLRSFGHAIDVVRGKYDDPDAKGEVTSFQALTAALSATVGLGNIGGVAIAVGTGGPGATFWMILAGFLGMASKFTECTLGQMYRETRPDGRIMGGAMYYLSRGLGEIGLGGLGKILAALFAVICIGASFGGGNTFQVSQSVGAVSHVIPWFAEHPMVYGLLMAVAVGIVTLGGIRRIAATAEKIVPFMCGIYVLACIAILLMNLGAVPAAVGTIVKGAFAPDAMFGGFLGVLILGFKRAAFSNEAGIGSAAIAHSAARVPHPSREGIVALLEPFVDTIVVCTMTALVIVITGAYAPTTEVFGEQAGAMAGYIKGDNGAALTSAAMGHVLPFMPYVLAVAVVLFAYSTMISWSYYGERCWAYLFGDNSSIVYRLLFVVFVVFGSVATAKNILNFGDLLIFGMVLPNIVGVVLLSGKVKAKYDDYCRRLAAGEYTTFK